VVEANAIPVFADIDLETLNLCPRAFEAAITPRTRAVIVVHFAGLPADMDAILAIARKHRLIVIEDAAHAHAAVYKGRPVGALGHLGSFSFQSSKNLNSGEGGIITTNDEPLADACVSLHNCGRHKAGLWYEHHINAVNYRLGELQGALLNTQLDRLEAQTNLRDENGRYLAGAWHSFRGFTHRSAPPTAPAMPIICSPSASIRRPLGCRAPLCSRHWPPRALVAAQGIRCRSTVSLSS
jgi:dTDP-4-amino-4,6-dideoxygalactose transaminase